MKPFFASNLSARLALVASYDPERLSKYIREIRTFIETENAGLKAAFAGLFDIIFSYYYFVDQLFLATREDKEYNAILLHHIRAKLWPLEARTIAYYKAATDLPAVQRLVIPQSAK